MEIHTQRINNFITFSHLNVMASSIITWMNDTVNSLDLLYDALFVNAVFLVSNLKVMLPNTKTCTEFQMDFFYTKVYKRYCSLK